MVYYAENYLVFGLFIYLVFRNEHSGVGTGNGNGKMHRFTGTEALYRPYGL
jgi:hypothetical protein